MYILLGKRKRQGIKCHEYDGWVMSQSHSGLDNSRCFCLKRHIVFNITNVNTVQTHWNSPSPRLVNHAQYLTNMNVDIHLLLGLGGNTQQ